MAKALYDGNIYIGHSGKVFLPLRKGMEQLFGLQMKMKTIPPARLFMEIHNLWHNKCIIKSRKLINGELNFELDVGASVDGTLLLSGRLFVQLKNHRNSDASQEIFGVTRSQLPKTTIQGVGKVVVNNLVIWFC